MAKRKCPLVMIEWEDSMQPAPAWRWLEDMRDEPKPPLIASVGWLLHDTKRVKVLAPNMGGLPASLQCSGVMTIPTRCVVKVTRLKEPVRD